MAPLERASSLLYDGRNLFVGFEAGMSHEKLTAIFTRVLIVALVLGWGRPAVADPDHCSICGELYGTETYLLTDKVTGAKVQVCHKCALSPRTCFLCGLPTGEKFTELADGRVMCARDSRTAVIEEDKGIRLCRETREDLDHLFSRFLSFPDQNVAVAIVDRVDLQELFKFAGNDFVCPNVWGYLGTKTNLQGKLEHQLSLLSGLPIAGFKATCAHEYTHAWLDEHLPPARKGTLSRDSVEGFCELIAYLLCQAQGDEEQLLEIKRNTYTRGQIHLFIEAEQRYGMADVIDWVQFGVEDRLQTNELARLRNVEMPVTAAHPASRLNLLQAEAAPAPDKLVLNGITGLRPRAMALINGRTFAENEEGKVSIGKSNVVLRCLEIRRDRVRVLIVGSGEKRELHLSETVK